MGGAFARVVYVARTGSTNEDAAELLGDDAALGMTIVAEEQTRGVGRKGRSWTAPAGSALLFTTILPREIPTDDLWAVPFWAALCIRDALAGAGVDAALHWPNDLLLNDKKLAGILCVSRILGKRARVACGVGINVFRAAGVALDPPPAYCDDVANVERPVLLARILERFGDELRRLADTGAVARRWEAAANVPGQRYRLLLDGERVPFEATAVALAAGGGLVVERDGRQETIALADARALR
ncbi:MAG: biotin--[acetyl-CoA-carboxylase] ligase [Candidatus Tyrphobacter sp.]